MKLDIPLVPNHCIIGNPCYIWLSISWNRWYASNILFYYQWHRYVSRYKIKLFGVVIYLTPIQTDELQLSIQTYGAISARNIVMDSSRWHFMQFVTLGYLDTSLKSAKTFVLVQNQLILDIKLAVYTKLKTVYDVNRTCKIFLKYSFSKCDFPKL